MKWLVLLALAPLVACEKAAPPEAIAATTADGWQCFERAPGESPDPQGDVTFSRHRVKDGALEVESVHHQAGQGGATRLKFLPVGDHLEGTLYDLPLTVKLLAADGSHWTLSSEKSHPTFHEESKLVNGRLIVTSTDAGEVAKHEFVATSCDNVVAELAKYPR